MFQAAPLGANFRHLLLLHPDCEFNGVVDAGEFPGIAERDSDGTGVRDKILGFEFGEMGQFTEIREKDLEELIEADESGEGIYAVNLALIN